MLTEEVLFEFLKKHSVEYQLSKHKPVFTIEDGLDIRDSIPGTHSKCLFLKNTAANFFLVGTLQDKRVDLKALGQSLGCSRLSFGSPSDLWDFLGVTPGSVTPFGLLFDKEAKVTFILDKDFLDCELITFHALRNDLTISIAPKAFLACMEKMGHSPKIFSIRDLQKDQMTPTQ